MAPSAPSHPPPAGGGDGGAMGIVIGGVLGGLAVAMLGAYMCYRNSSTETERRVSLVKTDSAGRPENALEWKAASGQPASRALALSDEEKMHAAYTANV
eukprot:1110808-Prymnesium_polylepis.1